MIQLLALALSLTLHGVVRQTPSEVKWHSRAAFCAALKCVKSGWTMAQVKTFLGPPDDVGNWRGHGETWRYGTNGHDTIATLGKVQFEGSIADSCSPTQGLPPSTSVISDAEMTALIRDLSVRNVEDWEGRGKDPLRIIKAANELIPLGRRKALAVLREYARYTDYMDHRDQLWLFMLVRVMFKSRKPGGVFPIPMIGAIFPQRSGDAKNWPTYPVVVVSDVPISLVRNIILRGSGEPFTFYLNRCSADWDIRTSKLHPPNDPFLAVIAEMATSRWKARLVDDAHRGFNATAEDVALRQLATLVRSCVPFNSQRFDTVNDESIDDLHRKFLEVGGHWDDEKQLYVRKDGSSVVERVIEYPEFVHVFKDINDLDLTAVLCRNDQESFSFSYEIKIYKSKNATLPPVVSIEDLTTGTELNRYVIKEEVHNDPSVLNQPTGPKSKGVVISDWGYGAGGNVPAGHRLRFVVLDQGKKYFSPVFTP